MPESKARSPWLPYVAPMAVFLVLTALEAYMPKGEGGGISPGVYLAAYVSKILLVTVTVWVCRSTWRDFRFRGDGAHGGGIGAGGRVTDGGGREIDAAGPEMSTTGRGIGAAGWFSAVILGIVVYLAWVGLHGRYPDLPLMGGRSAFDPNSLDGGARILFLAARFYGLVLLVPLFEELFWRSFLMRWVIDPEFTKLPVGSVTVKAAVVTSALFALAHPEWLPALLTGLAWAILLWRTRSLTACLISHMVANLALGIHVVVTGSWWFW